MPYLDRKGLTGPKIEKTRSQKFLTLEQVRLLLDTVKADGQRKWKRDHCAIYLGYFLGLRISEACILERETFRHIGAHEARIRTSKSLPRVPVRCGPCGRRWRVSCTRIEQHAECPRCGELSKVHKPRNFKADSLIPPEKIPPIVETPVVKYVQRYMRDSMRPEQRWLLESHRGEHMSTRMLEQVFGHYVIQAGLDPEYSFHALRHGRGLTIYERFKDPVLLRDSLRQATLSAAEWYMNLSPERQQEYLDVLDGIAIEE